MKPVVWDLRSAYPLDQFNQVIYPYDQKEGLVVRADRVITIELKNGQILILMEGSAEYCLSDVPPEKSLGIFNKLVKTWEEILEKA